MDNKKRSNAMKKVAAVSALMLAVGGAGAAAAGINGALDFQDDQNAQQTVTTKYIRTSEDLEEFVKSDTLITGILLNNITTTGGFESLASGKTLTGNGYTIKLITKRDEIEHPAETKTETITEDNHWFDYTDELDNPEKVIKEEEQVVDHYEHKWEGWEYKRVPVYKTVIHYYVNNNGEKGTEITRKNSNPRKEDYNKWGYTGKYTYTKTTTIKAAYTETVYTNSPLFSTVEANAKIENFTVETAEGVVISETLSSGNGVNSYLGAVCRINNGTIRYVKANAKVEALAGTNYTSGVAAGILCGQNNGTIFACETLTGACVSTNKCYNIGSLCGENNGNLERSTSSSTVKYTDSAAQNVGGLCGYNYNHIEDCLFQGKIEGKDLSSSSKYVGGLCGRTSANSVLKDCLYFVVNENAGKSNCIGQSSPKSPIDGTAINFYRYSFSSSETIHFHDKNYPTPGYDENVKGDQEKYFADPTVNGACYFLNNKGKDRQWKLEEGWKYPRPCTSLELDFSAPEAEDIVYDGQPHPLTSSGTVDADEGTFYYGYKDGDNEPENWSTTVLQETNAGDYKNVVFKINGKLGFEDIGMTTVENCKIKRRPVNIDFNPAEAYTGAVQDLKPSVNQDNVVEGDKVGIEGITYIYTSNESGAEPKPVGKIEDAGSYVPAVILDNSNYCAVDHDAIVVAKAVPEITWSEVKDAKIDGTHSLDAETTSNSTLTYTSSNPEIATVDANGNISFKKTGEVTITITSAGTNNYNECSKTYKITVGESIAEVNKAPEVIKAEGKNYVYDGTSKQLVSAGTAKNGTLKYRLVKVTKGEDGKDTETPVVSEYTAKVSDIQATDAGTYKIYYKAFGDEGYKNSKENSVTAVIDKATFVIGTDKETYETEYGADSFNVIANVPPYVAENEITYESSDSDRISVERDGRNGKITVNHAAEDVKIKIKVAGTDNYNESEKTVTVKAGRKISEAEESYSSVADFVYGNSLSDIIGKIEKEFGIVIDHNTITDNAGEANTALPASNDKINMSAVPDSTEDSSKPYAFKAMVIKSAEDPSDISYREAVITFSVSKAELSVSWSGNSSYSYKEVTNPPKVTKVKAVNGESFGYTEKYYPADSDKEIKDISSAEVGSYVAVAILEEKDGAKLSNYNISSEKKPFDVVKNNAEVSVELAKNLTYNEKAQKLVSKAVKPSEEIKLLYSIDGGETWNDSVSATDAETYTVYYKAAATKNYNEIKPTKAGEVTIGQAKPTIKVTSKPEEALAFDSEFTVTATLTGVSGDTSDELKGKLRYKSSNSDVVSVDETTGKMKVLKVSDKPVTITVSSFVTKNYSSAAEETFEVSTKKATVNKVKIADYTDTYGVTAEEIKKQIESENKIKIVSVDDKVLEELYQMEHGVPFVSATDGSSVPYNGDTRIDANENGYTVEIKYLPADKNDPYKYELLEASVNVKVNRRELPVVWPTNTGEDSWTYGDTAHDGYTNNYLPKADLETAKKDEVTGKFLASGLLEGDDVKLSCVTVTDKDGKGRTLPNAGSYTASVSIDSGKDAGNYRLTGDTFGITVNKKVIDSNFAGYDINNPAAATGIVYNGETQPLLSGNVGNIPYVKENGKEICKFLFSQSDEFDKADTVKYGGTGVDRYTLENGGTIYDSRLMEKDAGEYVIYYCAIADDNHTFIDKDGKENQLGPVNSVKAKIEQAVLTVSWFNTENLVYNGTAQQPYAKFAGEKNEDTIEFKYVNADGTDFKAPADHNTDGQYYVKIKLTDDNDINNYKVTGSTECNFNIAPARLKEITVSEEITYNANYSFGDEIGKLSTSENSVSVVTVDDKKLSEADLKNPIQVGEHTITGTYFPADAVENEKTYNYYAGKYTKTLKVVAESTAYQNVSGNSWTYDGESHPLVVLGTENGVKEVKYSTDGGETWTAEIPEETNAGTYTVLVKVTPDNNHSFKTDAEKDGTQIKTVKTVVKKADLPKLENVKRSKAVWSEKMTPSEAKKIINGAIDNAGYREKYNCSIVDFVESSNVLDADTYDCLVIYNYSDPDMAKNYNDSSFSTGIVIEKAAASFTAEAVNRTYNGDTEALVRETAKTGITSVKYTIDGKSYDHVPAERDAGTYTVYYEVTPDENHTLADVYCKGEVKVTVSAKDITLDWSANKAAYEFGSDFEITASTDDIVKSDIETVTVTVAQDKDRNVNGGREHKAVASVNSDNYNVVNPEYTYTITKTPANVPADKLQEEYTAEYGTKVGDIELPANFEWKNPSEPVGTVDGEDGTGKNTHTVIYTSPERDGENNYEPVELKVSIVVTAKPVHVNWTVDSNLVYNGNAKTVTPSADLRDVFDDDEAIAVIREIRKGSTVVENAVDTGDYTAVAELSNNNYTIVKGDESTSFTITESEALKPVTANLEYEYGTSLREIYDDMFDSYYDIFGVFATEYTVDPETVTVTRNGRSYTAADLKRYINKAKELSTSGVIEKINQYGKLFYRDADFNIMNNKDDLKRVMTDFEKNKDRIRKYLKSGLLPSDMQIDKVMHYLETYEQFVEAEQYLTDAGEYRITVEYNHMADPKSESTAKYFELSDNYKNSTLTLNVRITPAVITGIKADIDSREYDGTTDVKLNGLSFASAKNSDWDINGYLTDSTRFTSPAAGTSTIDTRVTFTNSNFCFGYDAKGTPIRQSCFADVESDGEITKAKKEINVKLSGYTGDALSSIKNVPVSYGTFRWNESADETFIADGENIISADTYTFTPDAEFDGNYDFDIKVTVEGNTRETVVSVVTPAETEPAETTAKVTEASESETTTAKVTESSEPATTTAKVTEATKPATTTAKVTEAAKPATTTAKVTEATKPATTAKVTEASKPATTAKVTEATKPATTAKVTEATKPATTTAKVTEATAPATSAGPVNTSVTTAVSESGSGSSVTTKLPEITVTPVSTSKLMENVTEKPVTEGSTVTTAGPANTTAAVTTAGPANTTATVTTAGPANTTAAVTTAGPANTTATVTTAGPANTTAAVTTAGPANTTATVTTAGPADTTATVTTAGPANTTAAVTTAGPANTTAAVTTAGSVNTTAAVTTTATEPAKTEATASETTAVSAVTTTASETAKSEETSATLPTVPVIDINVTTVTYKTEASASDVTEQTEASETTPAVTDAPAASETTTGAPVPAETAPVSSESPAASETTPAETAPSPAVTQKLSRTETLDKILSDPSKMNSETFNPDRIHLADDSKIEIALEDKMFFQGTPQFSYTVRLKDFNASEEYFDYAGFGFELPEGFSVDASSVKTSLKANISFIEPGSIEAAAISAKTGYSANGGYIVYRGVDTSKLESDAELFTVNIKVADTAKGHTNKISVSTVYGRITDESSADANGMVTPSVSLIDNSTGDKEYTLNTSKVLMGLRGDADLSGKVTQLDANLMLREILAHDAGDSILLKDNNINTEGMDPEDAVKLSLFLGNVNSSEIKDQFKQVDATLILKAILQADADSDGFITEEIWKKVID